VPRPSDFDEDLQRLEAQMRKLETEYNMYFAGQLPRPPWETRASVEQQLKQLDRGLTSGGTYASRFRFSTLRSRYLTFVDLWDRGLRAREEGRPGPFSHRRRTPATAETGPADRIIHVAVFSDPLEELDKLHELYERLCETRRELGEPQVPFHRFAGLVRNQVKTLKQKGAPEVAFRVAVRDGKTAFTVRALKGVPRPRIEN